MKIIIPEFKSIKKRNRFLLKNQEKMIAMKKKSFKKAFMDFNLPVVKTTFKPQKPKKKEKSIGFKSENTFEAVVVLNTTNVYDSHEDVHISGIWNESLKEDNRLLHLKEHDMSFSSIISESPDIKAYVKEMHWTEFGFKNKGTTEALTFDSLIKEGRNPFMYNQYLNKWVKNHSVGMIYREMILAINSEDSEFSQNKEVWEQYFDLILNKEEVDRKGYFWAITKADLIEGSAVPIGSNQVTPTQSISELKSKKKKKKKKKDKKVKDIFRFLESSN